MTKTENAMKKHTRNTACAADYDEKSFWKKIREKGLEMGMTMVYKVLQLYYAMIDKDTPVGAKLIIAGALAYLVLPMDLIPDFLPGGYVDDMSAIMAALKTAEAYITSKVMERARKKTAEIFGVEVCEIPVTEMADETDEEIR